VEASLFTETEEQKKKIKEVKEALEKVQLYTNKIKRIEYVLENEVSQIAKHQLARDKESAEVYAEKWTLRADMLFNRRVSSLLNEKHGNYWIKIIENTDWDAEEYRQFYNHSGHEFLPKLIDYEIFEPYMELKMEYIEGDTPWQRHNDTLEDFRDPILRYLSYKIIPTLYEWSRLRMNKENRIYMHDDLKFDNFLITKNDKLYLMDINAFYWCDFNDSTPHASHIYTNPPRKK
jgi:serine/threonine protein kinase